jgi:hypothetical protein
MHKKRKVVPCRLAPITQINKLDAKIYQLIKMSKKQSLNVFETRSMYLNE